MTLAISNDDAWNSSVSETVLPIASSPAWVAISFLFEDAGWCDWLYREFDGARVPRPLLGSPSRFGATYPERISVCPDPADPVQLESYADSLKLAQHLILVVSPNSGRSKLLQEHIRLFKRCGGDERMIVLVVKGEPASPAADPGIEQDRAWLPEWLGKRFTENRFQPANPTEPVIVDARLGVESLSEVRAKLFAAILEVEPSLLAELGVNVRSTVSVHELSSTPALTPSSVMYQLSTAEANRRAANWPIWISGIAAMLALAGLVFWPTNQRPLVAAVSTPTISKATATEPAVSLPKEPEATIKVPPGLESDGPVRRTLLEFRTRESLPDEAEGEAKAHQSDRE